MVQFLSINFFLLDFFNFCLVFQKFPFFCVTLYISRWNDEIVSIKMFRSFNLCRVFAIYLDIHHFIIHI